MCYIDFPTRIKGLSGLKAYIDEFIVQVVLAGKILYRIRMLKFFKLSLICFLFFAACEDTNIPLATDAGMDMLKAVTLSDKQVILLASEASKQSDSRNRICKSSSPYSQRLRRLVGNRYDADGYIFNFKVYSSSTVNAFAMADGTIRLYSGLMDLMDDHELLFVIGHEMGHVVNKHVKKKIMLAYAASAVRKGVASQENIVGAITGSALGGFVQALLNAQFSQAEEREADDYGILFLKNNGFNINASVSALNKLDTLGKNHTFLSSHPDPALRAERLQQQIDSPETLKPSSLFEKLKERLSGYLTKLFKLLKIET